MVKPGYSNGLIIMGITVIKLYRGYLQFLLKYSILRLLTYRNLFLYMLVYCVKGNIWGKKTLLHELSIINT